MDLLLMSPPRISKGLFRQILTRADSPAAPDADVMYDICAGAGMDSAIFLAIFHHESQFGREGINAQYNLKNPGSVRAPFDPAKALGTVATPDNGSFAKYASWQLGTEDWVDRLRVRYVDQGFDTVARIIPKYAPAADKNTPLAYIAAVEKAVAGWMQEDTGPMALTIIPLPSPNFSERLVPGPIALVIHTGEGTRTGDLATLRNNKVPLANRVSSNYYVCRDGTIYQLVDDRYESWHAGWCNYAGITDWNGCSLGVETEHRTGVDDWPAIQKDALAALCSAKIGQYHIKREMVVTHRWIAVPPGRKSDPGNWPDSEFHAWVDALYTPATWDGPPGTFPVDVKLQAYYARSGGLWSADRFCLGWALSPLVDGIQKFERGHVRLKADGTIEALLLVELTP